MAPLFAQPHDPDKHHCLVRVVSHPGGGVYDRFCREDSVSADGAGDRAPEDIGVSGESTIQVLEDIFALAVLTCKKLNFLFRE